MLMWSSIFVFWSLRGRKPPCLVWGVSDESTAQVCMAHLHIESRICWNFVPFFKWACSFIGDYGAI